MEVDQLMILALGPSALYMSQSRNPTFRRWACIVGLSGQVFWFYATWVAQQWGMFAASFIYTYAWLVGLYNYWIKEKPNMLDEIERL